MTRSRHWSQIIPSMTDDQRIPWKRLYVEAAAIVGSILLAFAIDAWWDEIGDQRSERVLLEALDAEFKKNQELLDEQIGVYQRRTSAASALLSLGSGATNPEPDILNSHWRWVIRGGTYDPSTGVLDAAVSSGNITVIRDSELRVALANWPALVEDLNDVENLVTNLVFNQLVPWIRLQTALPDGSFAEFGIPEARSETDFDLLSSSIVMENFLREEVAWGRILDQHTGELNETIALIQTRIRLNLDNP